MAGVTTAAEVALSLREIDDQLYLGLFIEDGYALDFSPAAALLDTIHPDFGPSLLTHIESFSTLVPVFTPACARDFIEWWYWEGEPDDSSLQQRARDDLAEAREVRPESLSPQDVQDHADSMYLTLGNLNQRLEPRYQRAGRLSLTTLAQLCAQHRLERTARVVTLLHELEALGPLLPEDEGAYEREGNVPLAAVVTLGTDDDLVGEIYAEHQQVLWDSGEIDPVFVLALDPQNPADITRLLHSLALCKRMLTKTHELFKTLEGVACLFP